MNDTASTALQPVGGFWRRLLSSTVDGLLGSVAATVLLVILTYATIALLGRETLLLLMGFSPDSGDMEAVWQSLHPAAKLFWSLGGPAHIGLWLYFAIAESSSWQATPGKRLWGMKVASAQGGRIGFGRASARYWLKLLILVLPIVNLSFFMIAFTRGKRGPHDFLLQTAVLRTNGASHQESLSRM